MWNRIVQHDGTVTIDVSGNGPRVAAGQGRVTRAPTSGTSIGWSVWQRERR